MFIAAFATVLTLVLGFGAALAVRLIRRPAARWGMFFAGMGYALPGTVLALGLLAPLVAVDGLLNRIVLAVSGVNVGLLLVGIERGR